MCYLWMYKTSHKTKVVEQGIKKLQTSFRHLMDCDRADWKIALAHQEGAYNKAWDNTFNKDNEDTDISLGYLIMTVYDDINHSYKKKWVGSALMQKVIISFIKNTKDITYQTEQESKILAEAFLTIINGKKKELTAFQKRVRGIK